MTLCQTLEQNALLINNTTRRWNSNCDRLGTNILFLAILLPVCTHFYFTHCLNCQLPALLKSCNTGSYERWKVLESNFYPWKLLPLYTNLFTHYPLMARQSKTKSSQKHKIKLCSHTSLQLSLCHPITEAELSFTTKQPNKCNGNMNDYQEPQNKMFQYHRQQQC